MSENSDNYLSISVLTNEIKKLRMVEDMKRREHASLQDGLQDTWDKLVNLRSHISLFKSSIEEVRVEEATYFAHAFADSNEGKSSELTSEMATRLGNLHALREKVRLKEALKSKIVMMEEQLDSMRQKLSQSMEELSQNGQSSVINAGSSHAVTSPQRNPRARSTSPTPFQVIAKTEEHRVEDAMSVRAAVLETSRQLEVLEKNYVQSVSELEFVELEINEVLKWNPEYADGSADDEKEPRSTYSLDESSSKTSGRSLNQSSYCPVSLHEILSGQAHIIRINGEAPTKYRQRLEKRLAALMVLDEQLQKELNAKNEVVNKVRSVMKDIEIQRLRKEVELNNMQQELHSKFGSLMVYNQTTQQTTSTTTIDNSADMTTASQLLIEDLNESSASADSGFEADNYVHVGGSSGEQVFPGSMMMPSRSGQNDDLPLHALSGIKAVPGAHHESLMSPAGIPYTTSSSHEKEARSERQTRTHTVSTHTKTQTQTQTTTQGPSSSSGEGDAHGAQKPTPYSSKGPRKPLGHINDPAHSMRHNSLPTESPDGAPFSHIGSQPVYPYGNSGAKSTKSQVESMLQRLENLAKAMEQKIDLTSGHKELISTVSRQQDDLDSLRMTQANLVKLLQSESVLDSEQNKEAIKNLECNVHDVSARHQELRKLREHLDDPDYVHEVTTGALAGDANHVRLLSASSDDASSELAAPADTNVSVEKHENQEHGHAHGRHVSPGRRHVSPTDVHKDDPASTFGHGHGYDHLNPHPEHHIHGHEFDPRHHELKPTHNHTMEAKHATVLQYDEQYLALVKRCDLCRDKYNDALTTEYIDRDTDTCIDSHTRLSLATLDVKVKTARNLPITKRVTKSCDPFIELFLVSTTTPPANRSTNPNQKSASSTSREVVAGPEGREGEGEGAPAGAEGHLPEELSATPEGTLRPESEDALKSESAANDVEMPEEPHGSEIPAVNVFNKQSFSTHVVHNDMRPRWEAAFRFNELFNSNVDSSLSTQLNHLSQPNNHAIDDLSKSLSIFLLLMDHNRTAVADIIGECSISLSDFVDQEKHVIWAPIKPPVMEVVRSRPKLPNDCAAKLEIRLSYNRQKVWKKRFNNANRDLAKYIEQWHIEQQQIQEREASYRKRKQEEAELSKSLKNSSDIDGDDQAKAGRTQRHRNSRTPPRGQGPRPKTSSSGVKFTTKRMLELASQGQLNKPTSTSPQSVKRAVSPQRSAATITPKKSTSPARAAAGSGTKRNSLSNSGIKLTLQYRIGGNNSKSSIQTPFAGRTTANGSSDASVGEGDDLTIEELNVSHGHSQDDESGGDSDSGRKSSPKSAYVSMPITAATRESLGLSNNVVVPFEKPTPIKISSHSAVPSPPEGKGTSIGSDSSIYSPTTFVRSPNLRTVTHSVNGHHEAPSEFHSPKKKSYDKKAFLASLISTRTGKVQSNSNRRREDLSSASSDGEALSDELREEDIPEEDLEMF